MAITNIKSYRNVKHALEYIKDDEPHTYGKARVLESFCNACVLNEANYFFQKTLKRYRKLDHVQAYTIITSWAEDELDPNDPTDIETGRKIAVEIAQAVFGNDRQYVVVLHNDSTGGKLHAHIVGNSVDFKTGRSLCGEKTGHKHLMRVSDKLQEKYGVKNKNIDCDYKKTGKNNLKSHKERKLIERGGYSWKKSLEDDINKSINATRNCNLEYLKVIYDNSKLKCFLRELEGYGITYKVKKTSKCDSGFSITYTYLKNDKEYKVRDYKLCDTLTYKNLQKLIDNDFIELEPAPTQPESTKVETPPLGKKTSQSTNTQPNQKTTPTTQSINQILRKSKVTPKNNSKPKNKNNNGPDF